jgi:hypothetical protein
MDEIFASRSLAEVKRKNRDGNFDHYAMLTRYLLRKLYFPPPIERTKERMVCATMILACQTHNYQEGKDFFSAESSHPTKKPVARLECRDHLLLCHGNVTLNSSERYWVFIWK